MTQKLDATLDGALPAARPRAVAASPADALRGADYLSLAALSRAQVAQLFETAGRVKKNIVPYGAALASKTIILIFEKPSLRTRVTFEVGPAKMGAHVIFFDHSKERIGARESVKDYAKNLERMVDCVVARVFNQEVLDELAEHARVPIINALSDVQHPCQGLADFFTLAERFGGVDGLRGLPIAYVGDGNNVCASLMHGAAILGCRLTVVTPKGYEPEPALVEQCVSLACASGGTLLVTADPGAVAGAAAVYTDTWVSMGDEDQKVKRMAAFAKYRVDETLMAKAGPAALFMHCLPAHRGAEVTDGVIDAPTSVVYDQAENRMHVQNALLLHTLGGL